MGIMGDIWKKPGVRDRHCERSEAIHGRKKEWIASAYANQLRRISRRVLVCQPAISGFTIEPL